MASEIQNLNPTVLNAADLPTRLSSSSHKPLEGGGLFASTLSPANPINFPLGSLSSGESDSEGDLLEEPIDEQEIYGKFYTNTLTSLSKTI